MKDYYIDSPPPRPQRARRRQSPLAPTPCRAAAADDAVLPLKVAYISAAAGQVHVPRPPSPDVSVVPPMNIFPQKNKIKS